MTGLTVVVPVEHAYRNVCVAGIARLLYQPHAGRRRDWLAQLARKGEKRVKAYDALAQRGLRAVA